MLQKSISDYFTDSFLFGDDGRKSLIPGTEQGTPPALPVYDRDTNQSLLEKTLFLDKAPLVQCDTPSGVSLSSNLTGC